jgi:hypothetical protein
MEVSHAQGRCDKPGPAWLNVLLPSLPPEEHTLYEGKERGALGAVGTLAQDFGALTAVFIPICQCFSMPLLRSYFLAWKRG